MGLRCCRSRIELPELSWGKPPRLTNPQSSKRRGIAVRLNAAALRGYPMCRALSRTNCLILFVHLGQIESRLVGSHSKICIFEHFNGDVLEDDSNIPQTRYRCIPLVDGLRRDRRTQLHGVKETTKFYCDTPTSHKTDYTRKR